ncbi:MAG: hypothetical protein NT069_06305 [Planctomycetota bacterium]|nr:hypothetical protein [Planctomycetota bacterium]
MKITARAARRLYWHVINSSQAGIGLVFFVDQGLQNVKYADAGRLDPSEYWISRFGRIPIAVHRDEAVALQDFLLDISTFPPGIPHLHIWPMREGLWASATDPGRLRLSTTKLAQLHPELFRSAGLLTKLLVPFLRVTSRFGSQPDDTSWIDRWIGVDDPEGQAQVIERLASHIWSGDANPAVVVSLNPLIVAAYSPDIDNVMLLRLPDELVEGMNGIEPLSLGTRLVTCNTYGRLAPDECDIPAGPLSSGAWSSCVCVIADLISDDRKRLEELKHSFTSQAWGACDRHARRRLENREPCRDGRPNFSWIPVAWQKNPAFRLRGGYLH